MVEICWRYEQLISCAVSAPFQRRTSDWRSGGRDRHHLSRHRSTSIQLVSSLSGKKWSSNCSGIAQGTMKLIGESMTATNWKHWLKWEVHIIGHGGETAKHCLGVHHLCTPPYFLAEACGLSLVSRLWYELWKPADLCYHSPRADIDFPLQGYNQLLTSGVAHADSAKVSKCAGRDNLSMQGLHDWGYPPTTLNWCSFCIRKPVGMPLSTNPPPVRIYVSFRWYALTQTAGLGSTVWATMAVRRWCTKSWHSHHLGCSYAKILCFTDRTHCSSWNIGNLSIIKH